MAKKLKTIPIIVRVSRQKGLQLAIQIRKVTKSSARPAPPQTKPIGKWGGHVFTVSPSLIRGFTDLKIKGSCETNEKNKSKQKYYVKKYGNAREVSMTIGLNAYLGISDVQSEAMTFIEEATDGKSDYFYLGERKLFTSEMCLVSAEIAEIVHFPGKGNVWVSCKINVSFKQGGKNEGGSSSSSSSSSSHSSSKKSSTKKSSTKKSSGSSSKVTNKTPGNQIVASWSSSTRSERSKQREQAKAKAKATAANAKAASKAAKKGMITK